MSGREAQREALRTRHVDEAVSRRFRELREAMGLTRTQVAADMGASVGRWQSYEGGHRIPASRIWQFCRRYGLDVADLYVGLPFTIGPVESPVMSDVASDVGAGGPTTDDRMRGGRMRGGVAEAGAVFEPAPDAPPQPYSADATMRAISEAAAELNPLERSMALAALRGMSTRRLKHS